MNASSSIVVHEPIEAVFEYMTRDENVGRWLAGRGYPKRISAGATGPGAIFRSDLPSGGKVQSITYVVTEYDPPVRFGIQWMVGPIQYEGLTRLQPERDGTLITNSLQIKAGNRAASAVLGLLGPVFRRQIERYLPAQLQSVKAQLEGAIRWYHSIPLGDTVTDGHCQLPMEQWTARGMPAELAGKSVLDIGAWDGFFSFEAERRGAARVLAIDNFQGESRREQGTAGFQHAKAFLRSRVEFQQCDIMEVDRLGETFDLILCLGVYYHLEDPVRALRLLYDRLRPGGLLLIEGIMASGTGPALYWTQPAELEPYTYCVATPPWFEQVLPQIGYQNVQVLGGLWAIRDYMAYYAEQFPFTPLRFALASANRLAWQLQLNHLPFRTRRKVYRGLIRAERPAEPGT